MAGTGTQAGAQEGLWRDKALMGLLARFALYATGIFTVVLLLDARTSAFKGLRFATATTASFLINMTGVHAVLVGDLITIPNRVLAIQTECTGLFVAAMLSALILAYPVRLSVRLWGIVAGAAIIAVANLLRLVLVAYVSVAASASFDLVHDFLFQVGMVLVALAVWAGWLAVVRSHAS